MASGFGFTTPRGVDAVLNLANEVDVRHNLPCLHLRLDASAPIPRSSLSKAVDFLVRSQARNLKVLVHCYSGASRSASVVSAFLAIDRDISPQSALNLYRKRPGV